MQTRGTWLLLISFMFTLLIINLAYQFEGTATRLGQYEFISESLGGADIPYRHTGNRFESSWLGSIPVPFPGDVLRGIDYLRYEMEHGMQSYMCGHWQHRGWWYFHAYAIAVKWPLTYWFVFLAAFFTWVRGSLVSRKPGTSVPVRGEWILLMIPLLFFCLVSSQTGFTRHIRYVLPCYGFLILFASRVFVALPKAWARGLVLLALVSVGWFHVSHAGQAHTFMSVASGGPNNGWRHLSFSSIDWGKVAFGYAAGSSIILSSDP